MNGKFVLPLACIGMALCAVLAAGNSSEKTHKITTISTRKMADSLHAVIAADRQAYAQLIVQTLANDRRVSVNEHWQGNHGLPVHSQMLKEAARNIQKQGAEFSYTLRSLWPLDENNGPQTQMEQAGLEFVAKNPGENYYAEETLGGRSYFTAIYADKAVLPSCIECHNKHPNGKRHDFKLNEIMGGIVVRVPLEF